MAIQQNNAIIWRSVPEECLTERTNHWRKWISLCLSVTLNLFEQEEEPRLIRSFLCHYNNNSRRRSQAESIRNLRYRIFGLISIEYSSQSHEFSSLVVTLLVHQLEPPYNNQPALNEDDTTQYTRVDDLLDLVAFKN